MFWHRRSVLVGDRRVLGRRQQCRLVDRWQFILVDHGRRNRCQYDRRRRFQCRICVRQRCCGEDRQCGGQCQHHRQQHWRWRRQTGCRHQTDGGLVQKRNAISLTQRGEIRVLAAGWDSRTLPRPAAQLTNETACRALTAPSARITSRPRSRASASYAPWPKSKAAGVVPRASFRSARRPPTPISAARSGSTISRRCSARTITSRLAGAVRCLRIARPRHPGASDPRHRHGGVPQRQGQRRDRGPGRRDHRRAGIRRSQ